MSEPKEGGLRRLSEIDVIKTLTIFFMILIHVEEVVFSHVWEDKAFCPNSVAWTYFDGWITFLTPAWFMFAMGMTMNFTRHGDPAHWMSRGWKLIVAWFALKLTYAYPLGVMMAEPDGLSFGMFTLEVLFVSDIFFFAGAFFLYFGFLRRLRVPPVAIAILSLVIFTAGQFLYYPNEGVVERSLVGNFVRSADSAFPFFNWVLHPLLGFCWGGWLLCRAADRERVYRIGLAVSATVLLAGIAYRWHVLSRTGSLRILDLEAAYGTTPRMLIVSFVLFVFAACVLHFALRALSSDRIEGVFRFVSVRLTEIYCIQWVIIPWAAVCLPRPAEGSMVPASVILGWTLLVFAGSVFASCFLNRRACANLAPRRKAGRDADVKLR